MKNTENLRLLEVLHKNHDYYVRYALRLVKNPEYAEDLIQNTYCKLLRIEVPEEIKSTKDYLHKMIRSLYSNHYSVNKKYVHVESIAESEENPEIMDTLIQNEIGCSFESDAYNALLLRDVIKALKTLPNKQRKTIEMLLQDKDLTEVAEACNNGSYETAKANKGHALKKLKEIL